MEVDYNKQEINLRRLLSAVERLASTSSRELALEATAASAFMNNPHTQNEHYKSPYVITLFKKYIEEISRILDSLSIAREEWDSREERQRDSLAQKHGILPSQAQLSSSSIPDSDTTHTKRRVSPKEPPPNENLEEYRRKLSFLANLLNAPRWNLPQNQANISRVVRNQRIPYHVQLSELETVAKVQVQVRDNLRSQLTLPRLASDNTTLPSSSSNFAELSSDDTEWVSSTSSPRMSSPTHKMMHSSRSVLSSPSASEDPMDDLIQDSIDSDDYDTVEAESDSTQGTVVRRQLWKTDSSASSTASSGTHPGRRLAKDDEADLGDTNRMLQADMRIQDELTDELMRYTTAMKESALHAGMKIRSDANQLDKMVDKLDANTHATQSASSTVTELLNTTSTSFWAQLSMMSTVVIVFIVLYIFIKIVPKP